jgi:nucleoside-diphosphate-sugar epimerase
MNGQQNILILGCGYLGAHAIPKAQAMGMRVDALTRNEPTAAWLSSQPGVGRVQKAMLASHQWHGGFNPSDYAAVWVLVGSAAQDEEGYRQSYYEGLRSVIEWAKGCTVPVIFSSSTAVYGGSDGNWLDEGSAVSPEGWRGQWMFRSEQLLLGSGLKAARVLRLGGIYGAGRDRFLTSLRIRPGDDADGYLNLIEVGDAATALLSLSTAVGPLPSLMNLTDHAPCLRSAIASRVKQLHPETFAENTVSSTSRPQAPNRRIDARLIQQTLRWKPRWSSVLEYLDAK